MGCFTLELEWNNKTEFYDRDLNNLRLLFDLRVADVGVVITPCDELQEIFNALGKGSSYGPTTRSSQSCNGSLMAEPVGDAPCLRSGCVANPNLAAIERIERKAKAAKSTLEDF
jgi:hypothetical protein